MMVKFFKLNFTTLCLFYLGILLQSCNSGDSIEPAADEEMNKSLSISGTPEAQVDHNRAYIFEIDGEKTEGDTIIYFDFNLPSWLDYDVETSTISGVAGWELVDRVFSLSFHATNHIDTVAKSWTVQVNEGEIICNQPFGDPLDSEYILPYKKGESYEIIQSYCPSNPNWGHFKTFAYDFEMAIGDTVIASRGGEVIATQNSRPDNVLNCGGGTANWVFILHDDGTVMQYVHLKQGSVRVSVGEDVKQGDVIGLSGNSGCSSGPHTHVSLFRERGQYGPNDTLPFNYKNAQGSLDENNGLSQNEWYEAI